MGDTEGFTESQIIFFVLTAVSSFLGVLFLLSLFVIAVLVLCVLRLKKQMRDMKGTQQWKLDYHHISGSPGCYWESEVWVDGVIRCTLNIVALHRGTVYYAHTHFVCGSWSGVCKLHLT